FDPYEYARALWFEEYADSKLADVLGRGVFFHKVVAPRFLGQQTDEAAVQKTLEEDYPPVCDYLESQLAAPEAIAGTRFSIGDIAITSQFQNFRHAGYEVDAARWPKLAAYLGRHFARPSFAAVYEEERPLVGG